MKQRILRILMALVLLLGLLPTAALAAEGSGNPPGGSECTRARLAELIYSNESLKSLINAAGTGGAPGFTDLEGCTEAQKTAVLALAKAGVLNGTSPTTFDPNGTVTRAEAAVVLWRATGCKSHPSAANMPYMDMTGLEWYAPAVLALTAADVISGNEEGEFSPNAVITENMVSALLANYSRSSSDFSGWSVGVTRLDMLMEAYQEYRDSPVLQAKAAASETEIHFGDIGSCTDEEQTAIQFFTKLGVVSGYNPATTGGVNLFAPYAAASNVQIAIFLQRCATLPVLEEQASEPEPAMLQSAEPMTATLLFADEGPAQDPVQAVIDGAFAFLEAQGLSVNAAKGNPHAPGLIGDLSAWNEALVPAAPTFAPAGGTFTESQSVVISATTADADIYYTTDGSAPTMSGSLYTEALTVTETTTIKAIAVKNNLVSEVTATTYTKADRAPEQTPPAPGYDSVDSEHTYSVQKVEGVKLSHRHAEAGETVTLTITDDAITGLIVTDRKGRELQLTDEGNGKYSFEMPKGTVTITPVYAKAEVESVFTDVEEDHWALDAIRWVYDEGLMTGSAADVFHPEGRVTRQQVWMILARMFGYGPEDLTAARGWAVAAGVSDGTAPGGDVTRQQLVTLIWRAMGEPEGRDGVLAEYPDLEAVSPYAREAMAWAVENGIIGGTTQGTLYPAGTATRAQLAAILHRYAGPGESWGNSLKTGCGGRQQPPGHLI